MNPSEYFPARVETLLTMLPDKALETGVDVVTAIVVYDLAIPPRTIRKRLRHGCKDVTRFAASTRIRRTARTLPR